VAWLPVTVHIFCRLWPFFDPRGFAVTPFYRLAWWVSFHLSVVCMVYVMVQSFWRYADRPGPVWAWLQGNSYGVYIVHVIAIGVFGTLLLNTRLPAVARYLLLFGSTYLGSNLLVAGYRGVWEILGRARAAAG
jgi:hypothetical protein